jgi:nucleotide-binding universal stress UspA family protein
MSDAAAAPANPRCMVLGYDASDSSRLALSWAASELQPDGKLVLVRSGRALHVPASPLSSSSERDQLGRAIFDELVLDVEDSLLDLQLITEVSEDDPASALLDAANRHGADAIVVGCERHSALHRALGVLTTQLLEHADVPIISVPSGTALSSARGGETAGG